MLIFFSLHWILVRRSAKRDLVSPFNSLKKNGRRGGTMSMESSLGRETLIFFPTLFSFRFS